MSLILLAGKHSCLGALAPLEAAPAAELPDRLDVPVMLVYQGKFETANTGKVHVKEEHIDRVVERHNSLMGRIKRLIGTEDIPARHLPPVQVDHSVSAWDTVGRVIGPVHKGVHTLEGGETVPALYGTMRLLGKENVQRYLDGRWTNVSVGCDFEEGKLMESSIVPFPAAPDAAMLSGTSEKTEGTTMKHEKLRKHLTESCKMSEEDAEKHLAKLKAHLSSHHKMSEEEAEKRLEGMTTDEHTSMSKEMDDHEKLAAQHNPPAGKDLDEEEENEPEHKHQMAAGGAAAVVQLSADAKSKVKELAGKFRTTGASAQLEGRKAGIMVRLSKLQADAKITPAEVKKIDVAKLAAATQETVDAVFGSYEAREPVVLAGVYGTAKATNAAELARELKGQQLQAETVQNMPGIKKAMEAQGKSTAIKRFSSLPADKPAAAEVEQVNVSAEAFAPVLSLLEGGKADEAKTELKKVVAKLASGNYAGMTAVPKETEAQLSALADSVKSMQDQFEELMKLVGPVLG